MKPISCQCFSSVHMLIHWTRYLFIPNKSESTLYTFIFLEEKKHNRPHKLKWSIKWWYRLWSESDYYHQYHHASNDFQMRTYVNMMNSPKYFPKIDCNAPASVISLVENKVTNIFPFRPHTHWSLEIFVVQPKMTLQQNLCFKNKKYRIYLKIHNVVQLKVTLLACIGTTSMYYNFCTEYIWECTMSIW